MLAFMEESRSEAPRVSTEGTESLAAKRGTESLAIGEQLMEEICERENCQQALARVKANQGSAGGLREVLRPGQSRQTDGKDGRTGERQAVIEADPDFSASRSDGGRAGESGG